MLIVGDVLAFVSVASGVPMDDAALTKIGCDVANGRACGRERGADTQSVTCIADATMGGSGLVSNAWRFALDVTRHGRGAAFETAAIFDFDVASEPSAVARLPASRGIRFAAPVLPATLPVRDAD